MVSSFEKEQDVLKKIAWSKEIMEFAMITGAGFYTIPEIENFYLDLAKTIKDHDVTGDKYPNSFLHVMTKAYVTGGHSRVVARWINGSDINEKHSVVLLNQENEKIPDDLQEAVINHNGELYVSREIDLIQNAQYLRNISLLYKNIVLHIHPNDPTAIVAYGNDSFKTPIVLFNHADHNYWCGSSIVDVVADIRDNGISTKYRNIKSCVLLRIPIESNLQLEKLICSKDVARKFLGYGKDEKIILTIGRSTKYKPIGGNEFCTIVNPILSSVEHSICIGIGPTSEVGNWSKYPGKFIPLDEIDYGETYFKYISACDLYIDSMPIGGGTTLVDVIYAHKPVIALQIFKPDFGNLVEGVQRDTKRRKFCKLAVRLLSDCQYAEQYATNQYEQMERYHGKDGWNKQKDMLMNLVNTAIHQITTTKKVRLAPIDDRCVFLSFRSSSREGRREISDSNIISRFFKLCIFYIWDKI